ncbi:MAG: hypothetical protein LBQ79_09020 [Deltaproteobacteria bacterium]|jgi:hypothetical protein|nr:hypothetical protein [Deltaproteobacteria bacterium]
METYEVTEAGIFVEPETETATKTDPETYGLMEIFAANETEPDLDPDAE